MNDRAVHSMATMMGVILLLFAADFDTAARGQPLPAEPAQTTAQDTRPGEVVDDEAAEGEAALQQSDQRDAVPPESTEPRESAESPTPDPADVEPDVEDPTQPSPLLREALEAEPATAAEYESALQLLAAADDPQRPLLERLADVEEALALLEQLAVSPQHHPADLDQRIAQARGAIDRLRAAPVAAPLWSGEQIPDIRLRARVVVQGGTTEAVMEVDGVPYRVVEGEELLIPSARGTHRLRIVELNGDVLRVEIPPLRGALVFR